MARVQASDGREESRTLVADTSLSGLRSPVDWIGLSRSVASQALWPRLTNPAEFAQIGNPRRDAVLRSRNGLRT
ncbi:hypothetical protein AMC87_PC00238 (plasmid) [Rhizobium phaseoli]|nr:hypothetical protein IE4803_PB00308 [Rhizobium etli bv. phaseoli str. IE4803]ANL24563.1 hypothetical protein AMJ96_PB00248 [Rhizobium sp. N113]ANL49935.1 hypothetical protein AMC87_PC00238 [Rhizobium phaseoli]ARM15063.1 hypothetical protein Bra5_PB00317 [Rhizobium phaseoli Brasil 5]ARO26877.1 hypothetical protein TAL182_PC00270 [Rhizobium sp. TAL182]ARQ60752.1 hypothetical protein Kim5_PA00282 [Rhizobium sp. Kim5]